MDEKIVPTASAPATRPEEHQAVLVGGPYGVGPLIYRPFAKLERLFPGCVTIDRELERITHMQLVKPLTLGLVGLGVVGHESKQERQDQ